MANQTDVSAVPELIASIAPSEREPTTSTPLPEAGDADSGWDTVDPKHRKVHHRTVLDRIGKYAKTTGMTIEEVEACLGKATFALKRAVDSGMNFLDSSRGKDKAFAQVYLHKEGFHPNSWPGRKFHCSEKGTDGTEAQFMTMLDAVYGPGYSDSEAIDERDYTAWGKADPFRRAQWYAAENGFVLVDYTLPSKGGCRVQLHRKLPAKIEEADAPPHGHHLVPSAIIAKIAEVTGASTSTPEPAPIAAPEPEKSKPAPRKVIPGAVYVTSKQGKGSAPLPGLPKPPIEAPAKPPAPPASVALPPLTGPLQRQTGFTGAPLTAMELLLMLTPEQLGQLQQACSQKA